MTGAPDYGDRARLGVIVPSGNYVAEPEIHAMLPAGVAALVTRLPLTGSSDAQLRAMTEALEPATRLLADAKPDLIGFHCTAVSTFAPESAEGIRQRIETAAGLPAYATADGILAALAVLGAKRVVLVTPYIAAVHEREIAFLASHGIAVVGGEHWDLNTNAEMGRVPSADILARTKASVAAARGADAVFVSCTAIRSGAVISALEAACGLPVITSNQVFAWHGLRLLGMPDRVAGYGHLFTLPGPARAAA